MSEMRVTFLGTGGSTPLARRGFPATLVQREGFKMLFDCGEGTQRQMALHGGLVDVDAVFLTHYHSDHTYGLPPLLGTYSMRGREAPLTIYGPPGLDRFQEFVRRCIKDKRLTFPVRYEQLSLNVGPWAEAKDLHRDEDRGFDVRAIRADHKVSAVSYAVAEPSRPGRLDPGKAMDLALFPHQLSSLKKGVSVHTTSGRLVSPNEVIGPRRPGRQVVISGDTRPTERLARLAQGADLLVHEATFPDPEVGAARHKGHSTVGQAVAQGNLAKVRILALHHFGPKVSQRALSRDLGDAYEETYVPDDGDTLEVRLRDE